MKTPTLMTQTRAALDEIIVRDRLRPVREAGVESLLASIGETGVMKDAIHLRKKKDGNLYLIAGAHRVEAARRLGWADIEAKVWTDCTDDWARLMEIDDNLAGAEMDALDTAVFLARRKEVYERLHPETRAKKGAALVAARWDTADIMSVVSFAKATAEKFGMTDRHVRRMIAGGAKLGPDDIRQLRRAPRPILQKDLIEIGKIAETGEKYSVIAALAEGKAKSAAEARRAWKALEDGTAKPAKDPVEEAFKALMSAWNRAPQNVKRRFVHEMGDDLAALEGSGE